MKTAKRKAWDRWYKGHRNKALRKRRAFYRLNVSSILKEKQEMAQRVKLEALAHYGKHGKAICRWRGCKVSDPDGLTLDHVNDDGSMQRKEKNRLGFELYSFLKRLGWPAGFQTLCGTHNLMKEVRRRRRCAS